MRDEDNNVWLADSEEKPNEILHKLANESKKKGLIIIRKRNAWLSVKEVI